MVLTFNYGAHMLWEIISMERSQESRDTPLIQLVLVEIYKNKI